MIDERARPASNAPRNRRRLLTVGVLVLIGFVSWRVLRRPLDARLFGAWEADYDHWAQQSCLLWLTFRPDGTVEETWDHIGEVSVGDRRWFVDNDQLVLHSALYWDNRWNQDGLRSNARLLWAELTGTPLGVDRYRIRTISKSKLDLEPVDPKRDNQPPILKFHRGRTL